MPFEEVWQFLPNDSSEPHIHEEEEVDSSEELLVISLQANEGHWRQENYQDVAFLAGQEVFMLVDSESTHCFINEHLAAVILGRRVLKQPIQVKVANGSIL